MAELRGSQTEKNLLKAFAGESQARNRYTYAAEIADQEGYPQIAAIFRETADNELSHARRFFAFMESGQALEIAAAYPAGKIGSTLDNLRAAAAGEHEEWADIYPKFAEVAKAEGFPQIHGAFAMIAKVEKEHEARYQKLAANVADGKVWKKDKPVRWKCRVCGYVHEGAEAPAKCPGCLQPRAVFEIAAENY